MRSALIHGVLLAVMLIYGYRTWTRDKTPKRDLGSVELWTKSENELVSIEYKSDKKTLKLERRDGPGGAYWWATEVGIEKRPKKKPEEPKKPEPPKPADGSGSAGSAASTGSAGSGSNVVAAGSGSAPAPAAGSGSGSAVVAAAGSAGSAGSATPPAPKPPTPPPAAGSGSGSAVVAAGSGSAPAPAAGSAGSGSAVVAAGSGSGSAGSGSAAKPAAGSGSAVAAGSGSGSAKPPTPPPPTEFEEVKKPPREYPLGPEGDKLVETYVVARAIRDLGPIDDKLKKESKLDSTKASVTVTFKDGTRSFAVSTPDNNTVRYLLDQSSNTVYVVSNAMFTGFETGENSIHLIDPRGLEEKELESLTLEAISRSKAIARIETEVEGKKIKTWGDPATNKAEPALQNFVDGLANLKPTEYFPTLSADTLTAVMKVTYRKGNGSVMSTLTLYKRDKGNAPAMPDGHDDPANAPKGESEYFILTPKTHVLAMVKKDVAQGIENNLPNVMSDNPTAPEPPKKPGLGAPGGHGGPGGKPPGLPPQLKPPKAPRTPPPGGAPGGHDGHGH